MSEKERLSTLKTFEGLKRPGCILKAINFRVDCFFCMYDPLSCGLPGYQNRHSSDRTFIPYSP